MKIKTDFLLPALVLCSGNGYALDFLFEPDFSFKERYDDNLRLQLNPKRTNFISTFSPGFMAGYLANNNEFKANFKWNELIYHGESALDFSEKIGSISHQYRSELFKTDLAASYSEQASLTTQLDETGSGDLQTQVARTSKSISPNLTYFLSEKNSLLFGLNYTDVAFDRPANLTTPLGFSDYTNQQFSATAIHTYSEQLSFNISGSYSEFESASNGPGLFFGLPVDTAFSQKSTTLNYQAGLQYAFSEQTRFSLSAGMRDTDTDSTQTTKLFGTQTIINNFSRSSKSTGHVFSANLSRSAEWGSLNFNAGQQLNPASSGTQQTSTSFSAGANYNFSERWTAGVNATYLSVDSVSTFRDTNTSNNRSVLSFSPNIKWHWTEEVSLDFSYSYRQQQFESNSQTAIGNSVQFQFSYQPQINRQVK
ncbi:hypothetical protein ACH518_15300 [Methylomonas sp. HW2-6]|uniref:hypothetical protein n=1 Tax=Methylomonas sp. HW2-6 TaxID=3376687 RepID=UPI004040FA75